MLLIYSDESGINYETKSGFFVDGPYAFWAGLLISESKYFHLERMFYDLVLKEHGLKNWQEKELHATDMWNNVKNDHQEKEKLKNYFEELVQLITKLSIPVVFGVQKKTEVAKEREELVQCRYAFLHALEHQLSSINETGVLIVDKGNQEDPMEGLVYDRTKWRYNPGDESVSLFPSKFIFESRSCFLLDQVHYVDSKKSLFAQLTDHVAFIIQRVFTYAYLKYFNHGSMLVADISKVPISRETFSFFLRNVTSAHFDKKIKDVSFSFMGSIAKETMRLDAEYLSPGYLSSLVNR